MLIILFSSPSSFQTLSCALLASESLSAPSLLPHDPRAAAAHDHHHVHAHDNAHLARAHAGPVNAPSVTLTNSDVYTLNPDGSYSYRYELSDGSFSYANADAFGVVKGGYGFKNKDGEDVTLEYTAGKEGFVPNGAHLPALPAQYSAAAAAGSSGSSAASSSSASGKYGLAS